MTKHIALWAIAIVLLFDRHLDAPVHLKIMEQLVHNEDPPAGIVRFGGGRGLDSSRGCNGIIMIGKAVSRLTNQERSAIHIHIFPPQATKFPQTQTSEHIEDDTEGSGFWSQSRSGHQPSLLLSTQHAHFSFSRFRQADAFNQIFM